MRLYLAHNFAAREGLQYVAEQLTKAGHEVTSRWIQLTDEEVEDRSPKAEQYRALMDLEDIQEADCLVLFTDQVGNKPGQGKFIELGYALAKGKAIILAGRDTESAVFYQLSSSQIAKVESIEALFDLLETTKREKVA